MDNKTDIYSSSPITSSFPKNYNSTKCTDGNDTNTQQTDSLKDNRCSVCNKKTAITGFKCKCGLNNCSIHRYADAHKCTYDWAAEGKKQIAKANPTIVADKITNRI